MFTGAVKASKSRKIQHGNFVESWSIFFYRDNMTITTDKIIQDIRISVMTHQK